MLRQQATGNRQQKNVLIALATAIKTIWSNERYQGKYRELLELMKRFKLCYELPNKTYIAPQLLEDKKPPHYHWDNKDNLRLRYRYDFMPKGILSRFIVEMNPYIDEPNVWRSGVILNKDNTKAEVIENYYDREIQIRLRGNNKRGLLEVITSELDKIHISYHNLKVDKLIPCNCNTCITIQNPYFHRLENLRNLLSKNSQVSQCQISGELVNIYTLIDDTIGRQELNKPNSKNVINFNINQGDDMNNPINQNHSGNGDNAVGKTTNKIAVGALDSTFHGQSQAIGQFNETPSQDLAEVAKEIQCLLDQLSQTYPTETKKDQKHFAVEAIDRIEQNPSLTQKLLSATKAGSLAALDSLLNHPAASFVIAAIDDLQND
nr:COR domain-containing protein [Crocosphaera sp.]